MRISVVHTTRYRYDAPVYQEPHTFRMRPRCDASQKLVSYELDIAPARAGRAECLDQDGNVVTEAWFREPMAEMSVRSAFVVETLRENPFDYLGSGELGAGVRAALGAYLARDEAVGEFASGIPREGFLAELNRRVFEGFAYSVRGEGGARPAGGAFAAGSGSCRDLAVLFCAACRCVGIPARFVSGYEASE